MPQPEQQRINGDLKNVFMHKLEKGRHVCRNHEEDDYTDDIKSNDPDGTT